MHEPCTSHARAMHAPCMQANGLCGCRLGAPARASVCECVFWWGEGRRRERGGGHGRGSGSEDGSGGCVWWAVGPKRGRGQGGVVETWLASPLRQPTRLTARPDASTCVAAFMHPRSTADIHHYHDHVLESVDRGRGTLLRLSRGLLVPSVGQSRAAERPAPLSLSFPITPARLWCEWPAGVSAAATAAPSTDSTLATFPFPAGR